MKDLQLAWDYYDDQKIDQMDQIINSLLNQKDIKSDIYISCLILRSEYLNLTGNDYKKSTNLANQALELSEKERIPDLILKSYFVLIKSLLPQGVNENLEKLIFTLDKYFSEQRKVDLSLKNGYYFTKGVYYFYVGDIDNSIKHLNESYELFEQLGKLHDSLHTLIYIGACYDVLANFKLSSEFNEKIIDIIKRNNKESAFTELLTDSYRGLSNMYLKQGVLDKATDYINQSLEISMKTSNFEGMGLSLSKLGTILFLKGEIDQSIHHHKLALDYFSKNGDIRHEIESLTNLLSVSSITKNQEKQNYYFEQIKLKYKKGNKDYLINLYHSFSTALILKESARLAERIDAQNLFKEIISQEKVFDFTTDAIIYYLELLIDELKYSDPDLVLVEIDKTRYKLMKLAVIESSQILVMHRLVIDARLSIIKLEFRQARKLLTQAQFIADELGLKFQSVKISGIHDTLLNKITQWENIVHDSTSIQERIELANIEEDLRHMLQKSYFMTQEEHELSIIVLLINSVGEVILSRKFVSESEVEDQLIAGLLSAINSFNQQTFKTNEPIERIKQGENTIIIKKWSNFSVTYAFKGASYLANKKVESFISKIKENKNLINELENFSTSLPEKILKQLDKLIESTFNKNKY